MFPILIGAHSQIEASCWSRPNPLWREWYPFNCYGAVGVRGLGVMLLWLAKYSLTLLYAHLLTHWGWVTHICISELTIIGSDNGLSPGRREAIIWTNDGILLIGPLETNFSEILFGMQTFSFKKMHLKMSSAKWRPFTLGPNVLIEMTVWYCNLYQVRCVLLLWHVCFLTFHAFDHYFIYV